MRYISGGEITSLGITPSMCVEWVRESLGMKNSAQLPAKTSVHPRGIDFYTTMPCLLPIEYDCFGVKIVSRIVGRKPALKSELLLYKATTGELLSIMEADWITQMRTGAVAALTIQLLQNTSSRVYSFVGLGSAASATMMCLQAILPADKSYHVKLLRYKNQAESFALRFAASNYDFEIVDTAQELIKNSDVLVSAVTEMPQLFCSNDNLFPPGILLVPIHTRGFQNCDLSFDRVVADDYGHVEHFSNFKNFRNFAEVGDILLGRQAARINEKERIIAYNVGIGLHDVWFAYKIFKMLGMNGCE